MSFDILAKEVEEGIAGKNRGIPMGFERLNRYIGIRKRTYNLIFGSTGSGKTSFMHSAYILNPFDWYIKTKPDVKFKVILFSMERSKIYTIAKWVSRKIFIEEGVLIPIQKLLGWWENNKLTKDEHDLFLSYKSYIDELLEIVDVIEGPQNPTGIYKYVKNYAEQNGKFESIDDYTKVYIPNKSNEIVIVAEDHLGLTKMEKGLNTKKEAIDKVSEYNQYYIRDLLGYIPVAVSQLTRNLNNPIYQKMDNFEPTLDDVKESGRPGEDSDCVISLFDPIRYRTNNPHYSAERFTDPATGAKHFRSIKILKNTYGEDDIGLGMAFMGATGIFKELPKPKNMENFDYDTLFSGHYYL
jgi:hypothetical protein